MILPNSEPNKFADKIIALIGMVHSLLRVKESLREILTARLLQQKGSPEIDRLKNSLVRLREKQAEAVAKAGMQITSSAVLGSVAVAEAAGAAAAVESAALVTSVEVGTLAGRNANMFAKSGTAAARSLRFARFAGGALSAATILLEARTMKNTLEQINMGHPCEKAKALREILKEIPTLPSTEQLDEECRIYVGAMTSRVNASAIEDAIHLIESKAILEWQATKAHIKDAEGELGDLVLEGATILDGDSDDDASAWESVTGALSASLKARSMPEDEVDSVVTPPVPHVVSTVSPSPTPMNSTTSTPSIPLSEQRSSDRQSALLERIKKFKDEESMCHVGGQNSS